MSSSTRMRLARPLVVLALLGSLTACGDNTDFSRGPTNCDASGENASNENDASCQESGNPGNDAPTTDDANPED
jgi:predicted small lipoprotein YifL